MTEEKPRWRSLLRTDRLRKAETPDEATPTVAGPDIDIAPNDPILAYFQGAPGAVDIDALELDSPGLEALRAAGVKLVVPLVTHGELIGLLNLGPRLSEQDYSTDDRKLLENLAGQAAPALRVAQLVREQEAEVRHRERYEQELRVAHLIQQNFLPRKMPEVSGWTIGAYYRSAREVGGDFYDFVDLPDGRIGFVAGDVTDKGVPAALVMASTRSVLRTSALRSSSPGEVLARVNDLICEDMPPKMFVTCLYGILEAGSGRFVFANAGHNLPTVRTPDGPLEVKVGGMPLGLMPGMTYEEAEVTLRPGDGLLLYSDGIPEAHDPTGDMFGFPQVRQLVGGCRDFDELIDLVLDALDRFTGPDWEQEDDITMVTLQRRPTADGVVAPMEGAAVGSDGVLAAFRVPSERGNERLVMDRVSEIVGPLGLGSDRLEKLKTAVSETAMNAIEHGNAGDPELPVDVSVGIEGRELLVQITDQGSHQEIPTETELPDLDAKLEGLQTPRGWGLFLIKNMVDEMRVDGDERHHRVTLVLALDGSSHDGGAEAPEDDG